MAEISQKRTPKKAFNFVLESGMYVTLVMGYQWQFYQKGIYTVKNKRQEEKYIREGVYIKRFTVLISLKWSIVIKNYASLKQKKRNKKSKSLAYQTSKCCCGRVNVA